MGQRSLHHHHHHLLRPEPSSSPTPLPLLPSPTTHTQVGKAEPSLSPIAPSPPPHPLLYTLSLSPPPPPTHPPTQVGAAERTPGDMQPPALGTAAAARARPGQRAAEAAAGGAGWADGLLFDESAFTTDSTGNGNGSGGSGGGNGSGGKGKGGRAGAGARLGSMEAAAAKAVEGRCLEGLLRVKVSEGGRDQGERCE